MHAGEERRVGPLLGKKDPAEQAGLGEKDPVGQAGLGEKILRDPEKDPAGLVRRTGGPCCR